MNEYISKQEVLQLQYEVELEDGQRFMMIAPDDVIKLHSVNPEFKTGHWIVHPKGIYTHLVCDNCLSNAPYDCQTNYCPNCGAKME